MDLELLVCVFNFFFFQAEDGIRDGHVTGVQTCALPILVRFEDHMDPIEFHVRKNHEDLEIPQPQEDPVVKHFVSAYRAALNVPEKQQNKWEIGRASCRERGER